MDLVNGVNRYESEEVRKVETNVHVGKLLDYNHVQDNLESLVQESCIVNEER